MKKRIISLLLCAVILMGTLLTGCSNKSSSEDQEDDIKKQAAKSTFTLSMFVVSEKEVSPEDQKLVQDAFNKITKSKFKTQVILTFATYDKYYETVEGVIEANYRKEILGKEAEAALKKAKKDAKADGVATDEEWFDKFYEEHPEYAEFRQTEAVSDEETTAEETVLVTVEGVEDSYITEVKYPDLRENQIDIIWIDSYDRYADYVEKEWLVKLDDELGAASKKLKEYINSDLMAWAKWPQSGTYAIPNNKTIGEYTYLLLNKKYMDKYNYDAAKLTSLASCNEYLADIAKYETDVIPVLGELPITQMLYWTYNPERRRVETDSFSLLGNNYVANRSLDPSVSTNPPFIVKNVFGSTEFKNQLMAIQNYKSAGYVSEDLATTKDYALRVVKGGAELVEEFGNDYYMNILEYPHITEEDVFSSMFGVSSYTRSDSRSMEIITYLNTNADLRNVLQYGVEGVHYKVNADKTITRLTDTYMMDLAKTGNAFVAYPEEGMRADAWKWGKLQNADAKCSMLISFRVSKEDLKEFVEEGAEIPADKKFMDVAQLETIKTLSAQCYEELQAVKTVKDMEALIEKYSTLGDKTAEIKAQTNNSTKASLYGVYYAWMNDTQLFVPED